MNIQTAIAEAHGEFHFDRYSKDWLVKMSTNCMAFALGLETASNSELYRVGALCGKKPIDQEYFSEYEVKELFLEDLQVLKLNVKQVTFEEIKVMELESNQYIVFLFQSMEKKLEISIFGGMTMNGALHKKGQDRFQL